jgi:recombination protein RecT
MVTRQELVAVRDKVSALDADLQTMLPKAIPSAKFIRTVHTALQLNPGIVEAKTNSILASCLKAAADGLLLDGREAALVVYRSKGGPVAQYLPMVYGIIKKVRQSGEISVFNSFIVYENDEFAITYGMDPTLDHSPKLTGSRGDPIGCYAVCKFKNGDTDLEWMTHDEIEAVRARSKARNSGPWVSDWGEMARKTLLRRISKRLPMEADAMSIITRVDELYDLGKEPDDYVGPARKERGRGAAVIDGDDEAPDDAIILDVDPETGEVLDDAAATESEPATPKEPKETAAQKKARVAKEKAAKKLKEAQDAMAAADEEADAADAEGDDEGEEAEEVSEDMI